MAVESVVAVASGVVAGSVLLLAFGLDSIIELASAGVLIWRLSVELPVRVKVVAAWIA
jgi:hypothetical protein